MVGRLPQRFFFLQEVQDVFQHQKIPQSVPRRFLGTLLSHLVCFSPEKGAHEGVALSDRLVHRGRSMRLAGLVGIDLRFQESSDLKVKVMTVGDDCADPQ